MAQFSDVERAVSAVQEILNSPHGPHIRRSPYSHDFLVARDNAGQSVSNSSTTIVSSTHLSGPGNTLMGRS
jgi:D-lactate dehydrogenase (cytochrome)